MPENQVPALGCLFSDHRSTRTYGSPPEKFQNSTIVNCKMFNVIFFYSHGDFLHALLCNENKNSVRVPPLSLRGYEGWATCGQNTLTGSPLDSLTSFFSSVFVCRPGIFLSSISSPSIFRSSNLNCYMLYKQEQKVLKTSAPRVNFMFSKQKSKNIH